MRRSKVIGVVVSALFAMVLGTFISDYFNIAPLTAIAGLAVVSVAMSFLPKPSGVAFAGVLREAWTGEVIKYLSNAEKDSFLEGIADYSQYVSAVGEEAQAIHLVDMDVLPEVLINNTTYPIPIQDIGENDVLIQLKSYSTKQTPVTDSELFALSYKKMETMKNRHGQAIAITKIKHAVHSLAPSGNTAKMPVLLTTGADDGTGRKRLLWEDVALFKTKIDDLEIPEEGRRLVLCNDHLNDLIALDQKFKDAYYNRLTGKLYNQLGFDIFDYVGNPYYTPGTKAKLSFGAVPAATDRKASVFFSLARAAKATGWTKMYNSKSENDPAYQRNMMNFKHYFVVMPTKEEARGAIVSANA